MSSHGSEFAGAQARRAALRVLEIESAAIRGLVDQLDESFEAAVALLHGCSGRVICTGMGKSGLVMRKVAATLSSTGTPALFLHPGEAIHGDLGAVMEGDVVLGASFSGRTDELLRLAEVLQRLATPLVILTGDAASPLATLADIHLSTAIDQEACPLNLAPTASTAAQLALCDALAMALAEVSGFSTEDFARLHPGGQLGRQLRTVRGSMHPADQVAQVRATTPLREVVAAITEHGFGIAAVVVDDRDLAGAITDGDLRRLIGGGQDLFALTAAECMTGSPKTIGADVLASAALKQMEDHKITALFVVDEAGRLEGLVHLHDLWRLELF
ncbi:MAG: KpsF/GutQ family sugar-phosphate isomerase [Acidobacteriota bacterium]|nr:KpsF/GutQ family sugar-phosphate isomerase [Acidobacteriota bacterium]